jgi:hypothetical protein
MQTDNKNNSNYFFSSPKDEYFEELKSVCIKFWRTFDDQFGYATEKINTIKDLKNVDGNFMSMVQMIHPLNRILISEAISIETRYNVSIRSKVGGTTDEFDMFDVFDSCEIKNQIIRRNGL